jgi:excisionase family DNA binding protein
MAQLNEPPLEGKRRNAPGTRALGEAASLPELLTADDVAAWLKISVKAVYAKAERGKLPGMAHVGRRLYFIRSALLHWLEQSRVPFIGDSP